MHRHAPRNYHKAFAIGVALNVGFVTVEAVFGFVSGSLALVADAGHNLTDVLGLLLAWGASVLANRPATATHTYGYRRGTILASLFSGLLLLVAVGSLTWEALGRMAEPRAVNGLTVIVVATIGVVINTATALLFISGREHDLNIRGAFLHMAADAAVSLGVVIAGLGILWTGWLWLDPAISLIIVVVIFVSTWGLLRNSLQLLMDKVPSHIDLAEVERYLNSIDGVTDVHDLHIWPVSTTDTVLTAHLVIPGPPRAGLLRVVNEELHRRFGIGHATLQIESGEDCYLHGHDW